LGGERVRERMERGNKKRNKLGWHGMDEEEEEEKEKGTIQSDNFSHYVMSIQAQ
jgi:hypothetical protein